MMRVWLLLFCLFNSNACGADPAPAGVPNYGTVIRLSRSAQLDAEGLRRLKKLGVDTILKLNSNAESPDAPEAAVLPLWPHPVDYMRPDCADLAALADQVYVKVMAGTWVHVHCTLGRDRTGALIALVKMRHFGFTRKQIQQDWKLYGAPSAELQVCIPK